MSTFTRNVLMSILLAMLLAICDGHDAIADHQVHVHITNDLSPEGGVNTSLSVHCKTQKKDLGGQEMAYRSHFEFVFSPSIIRGETRMDCDVEWDGPVRSFVAYLHRTGRTVDQEFVFGR
ncbi:hypothetical protein ACLB2K_055634 [Fragaria x ananassa]